LGVSCGNLLAVAGLKPVCMRGARRRQLGVEYMQPPYPLPSLLLLQVPRMLYLPSLFPKKLQRSFLVWFLISTICKTFLPAALIGEGRNDSLFQIL